MLGTAAQPDVRSKKEPLTAGAAHPETRELEAVGMPAGSYEPLEPKFNQFRAPVAGHYRIRLNAYSVWIGPNGNPKRPDQWFIPDLDNISAGRRPEPVTVY